MLRGMVYLIVTIFLAQVVVFGKNTYNISNLPVRGYEIAVLVLAGQHQRLWNRLIF